ncbi:MULTISPECIES: hypothetical protein [Stenotrophomonas]|nr:hypothetical protein [Stenotrophomonas sp. CFBP8994]MDY0979370.1 hypothetical protein [Stenotrophomonas sp. CFBP8994]
MLELQVKQQSLRGSAERPWTLCQINIQIHVLVASEETFGEVLKYTDGVS